MDRKAALIERRRIVALTRRQAEDDFHVGRFWANGYASDSDLYRTYLATQRQVEADYLIAALGLDAVIDRLVARGALFVVNHSAGKDSQAMLAVVLKRVPRAQVRIVHAELPGVDWDGLREHIEGNAFGLPVAYVRAGKTLLDMVRSRGMFPSPSYRQCTSDLKRGPIDTWARRTGAGLIVHCIGLRAQESSNRAKQAPLTLNERESNGKREVWSWLPIHAMTTDEVFSTIAQAGQEPHPAYAAGMSRLSCCFCIMASKRDLATAARLKPALYEAYVELEREIGQTMMTPTKKDPKPWLERFVGLTVEEAYAA